MARSTRAAPWGGNSPSADGAKERLIEAAQQRLLADGVGGVSIASVAREAGVTRPTVYRHFRDRAELLESALFQAANASRFKSKIDYRDYPTLQELARRRVH